MEKSFNDILIELAEAIDNPIATKVPKEVENEIAHGLAQVVGLPDFLKLTMGADMRRYFNATPDEQKQIKGAFARTAYLLSLTLPKQNFEGFKGGVVLRS